MAFLAFPWDIAALTGILFPLFFYALSKGIPGSGDSTQGFWSPHTANVDWCESNYSQSKYIVEFWNTLTCFPQLICCMHGIFFWKKIPSVLLIAMCAFNFTMASSALFHGTLHRFPQLLDQIGMFLTAIPLLIFTEALTNRLNRKQQYKVCIACFLFIGFITVTMISMPQLYFIFPLGFITFPARLLERVTVLFKQHQKDQTAIRLMKYTLYPLMLCWFCWSMEKGFCHDIPFPSHALFHMMFNYAIYHFIALLYYAHHKHFGQKARFALNLGFIFFTLEDKLKKET